MQKLQKNHSVVLWFGGTCLAVFALFRLPYFFMSPFKLLTISTDALWWTQIQTWFLRDGAGMNSEMLMRRIDFRLPTDIMWQRFAAEAGRWTGDLLFANQLLTAAIFIATVAVIFWLGFKILKSPGWASAFTVAVMFTAYSAFLRYPVLVPKLFGFLLFPLVLLLLLDLTRQGRGYAAAGAAILGAMGLYYVSAMYTLPAMAAATFFVGLYVRRGDRSACRAYFLHQVIFWLALAVVSIAMLFWLKGGSAGLTPPPLEITTFISGSHEYRFSHFADDIGTHVFSALGIFLGWKLLNRAQISDPAVRVPFIWCAAVFALLFVASVLSHALASNVGILRTTYYWRTGYYTYIPAGLCFFLGLRYMPDAVAFRGRAFARKTFIPVAIAAFVVLEIFARGIAYFPRQGAMELIYPAYRAVDAGKAENIALLTGFVKGLPSGSVIMMPPFHAQNSHTDVFEIEAMKPVVFSHNDSGDFLFQTAHTDEMYKAYTAYDTAMKMEDAAARTAAVKALAVEAGATHILVRKDRNVTLEMPVVFENGDWAVAEIK